MPGMAEDLLDGWMASVASFLAPLAAVADDFTHLTGAPVDLPSALFLRAGLAGFRPPGRVSANGSCHFVRTADGWVAVNLARPDDVASIPALLALTTSGRTRRDEPAASPAAALHTALGTVPTREVLDAAHLLGIAAAAPGSDRHRSAVTRTSPGRRASSPRTPAGLTVVDFSALWAGPLCARLLALAGAHVTTVESPSRPDGARLGSPTFHRWLHDRHTSRTVEFAPGPLAAVVADADIVIEASRPRALRRLGLDAEEFLAAKPGRVWLSITGYGRDDDRIAFGDDAAVAGGLIARYPDGPMFLGDAIADPVTGIHAARAVARSLAAGGGELVAVSMAGCAAALGHAPAAGPRC